jgi:hypothetical protein
MVIKYHGTMGSSLHDTVVLRHHRTKDYRYRDFIHSSNHGIVHQWYRHLTISLYYKYMI